MKGYVPVEIPTKRYIAAYIHSQLGERPIMNKTHVIGNKFYDLLQHATNQDKTNFSNQRYNAKLRIYISRDTHLRRGCNLNESNIKNFNIFIEEVIKERYRFLMDFYTEILPGFDVHLPSVRRILGINEDAWDTDSIKQDYFRYRRNKGLPLFYNKIIGANVPSQRFVDAGF